MFRPLRKLIDFQSRLASGSGSSEGSNGFKLQDQVVVRRPVVKRGAPTNEIRLGNIMAFGDGGQTAVVSFPQVGGRTQRLEVPLNQLSPVTAEFRRASVQFNPAFRQVATRSY